MKNRMIRLRVIAAGMALMILFSLMPVYGDTERIVSDWILPAPQEDAVELTEDIAGIDVTLWLNGEEIADGAAVPHGALLTANVSFTLFDAPDALVYAYRLPESVVPVETDWASLPNGRWRLADHTVTVEFDKNLIADAGETGASFAFSFYLDPPAELVLPGGTFMLPEEENPSSLCYEGQDVRITLLPTEDSGIPDQAELMAEERTDLKAYIADIANRLQIEEKEISFLRVFDLSIWAEGKEIEPLTPVHVKMEMRTEGEKIFVMHFANTAKPDADPNASQQKFRSQTNIDLIDAEAEDGVITFDADGFSLYAVAGITYEKYVLASDGRNYRITVTYRSDAQVPQGASLEAREIPADHDPDAPTAYDMYAAEARRLLGLEEQEEEYIRLFDIFLADEAGNKVEIAAPVTVAVELADASAGMQSQVIHFPGDRGDAEIVDSETAVTEENVVVSFETDGFSVYAIVDAPDPAQPQVRTVANLTELTNNVADNAFCLSVTRGSATNYYFKSSLNGNSCLTLSEGNIQAAAEWYFEPTGDGAYRIYTLSGSAPNYITNPSGNLLGLSADAAAAAVFNISQAADGLFYFQLRGQNKWLQYSNGGRGIRYYTDISNAGNSQITITYASTLEKDPYGLDGQSFGIAYHDESATSAALTAEAKTVSGQQRLAGLKTVMKPDVLDNEGIMLVAKDTDIQTWTFESVREDKYYVTTTVEGVKKYLTISGSSVTLTDEPDGANSLIQAMPGTGENKGKWHFSAGGRSLNLPGTAEQGFNAATGTGATTWMNLVQKSVLEDDDFTLYTARKVSVSDTVNMYNGQQVVIYTRVWNDEAKKYEFYALDHDGSLIRCYDVGDGIEWIGSKVNTALWTFTEYYNSDGTVSYYYEFQNTQYGDYVAPQVSSGQILSGHTIGVNLNGRRYGENYSTIIAWDDANYAYSGLKVEDGRLAASSLSEAQDFYFAVINPRDEDDRLSTVQTVDGTQYGISMRMMDFNNPIYKNRDSGQAAFMGGDVTGKGLLSTDLGEDGYPVGTSRVGAQGQGQSLGKLFNEMSDGSRSVNHLFLQSVYNESGYFEYDSTQNFAHLNGDGTFTVYDQLGAITGHDERKVTRQHGQFMPYNSIQAGVYAYDSSGNLITNQTSVLAHELPDMDPRKGEKLYNLGTTTTVDYFFGMEMQASFTQTASGLDAWGHDIIFEFSGDDDFWLYVDGELALDLGGVHQAQVGTINFRTGVITSSNGNSTLYETFRQNYEARGMSEAEITQRLDDIFTQNENGQFVFKDYTNHTMKMFYMERGAGASNLHMRFNLAAVKPGSFILSKKLSGTDHPDNSLIEFPYQIYYYSKKDGGQVLHLLGDEDGEADRVLYKDTSTAVKFMDSFTPADGAAAYRNVFFLRPGQSAEVNMPDDVLSYYVVECGVNPDVYDHVYMNGNEVTGAASGNPGRNDYITGRDTLDNRPKVDWDNHVSEGAMRTLSITKKLYDADGVTLLHYPENQTLFTFRLYLGNENASENELPPAFLYPYLVKDAEGNYCRWDAGQQAFVSLGITDYADLQAYLDTLTSTQQESIIFVTSPNGSISKIPADYTVEVRDLIVGTHYRVEERDWEIPKGYTRREADGYTRVDVDPPVSQETPISGVTHVEEDPAIEVRNQKGWGLTVEKVWTDKDFMTHDPIYFAVYLNGEMVEGSVRQLLNDDTDIYYFFDDLYDQTGYSHTFTEYLIREVTIENEHPTVEDGVVLDSGAVTPVDEGGTLAVGGTPADGSHQMGYHYAVHYEMGQSTGHNENVRTDRVTNSRPGIELYKTDWQGNALAGAVFTLKDENGADVSAETYVSGSDGLITIAYPPEGVYTLTETEAPHGYVVIDSPMTIHVSEDNTVTVTDIDEKFYEIRESQTGMLISIVVKDRETNLRAVKTDAETGAPLQGVHFALYPQVTDNDGNKRKDYLPMQGYEDLVTDADGVIPRITMDLNEGTYYLTETATLHDYVLFGDDLCFTIGADGTVTMESEAYQGWLSRTEAEDGAVTYTLTVENSLIVPDPVPVTVTAGKVLEGRAMREEEFAFTMTPIDRDGSPIGNAQTASSPASPAGETAWFTFSLSYDLEDYENAVYTNDDGDALFYYLVEETVPESADETGFDETTGIRYDRNRYLVTVILHYDRDQHVLSAEKRYALYTEGMLSAD